MNNPKRLENIDQLQWEIDAWMQHCIKWSEDRDIGESCAKKAAALDKAAQTLFEAFGQPDPEEKP